MTLTASPEAREASLRSWRALGARLQTVSPRSLARGLLMLGAVAVPAWIAVISWPALLPFAAGVVLAYAVLPIANRLDRYMPRVLAALVAEGVALVVLFGAAVIVLPPLVTSMVDVVSRLPTQAEAKTALDQLESQFGGLPEPVRGISLAVMSEVVANLQATLQGVVDGLGTVVTNQILGILNTVSFVLGLFVIPVWILTVVADERRIKQRSGRLVTPALRADVAGLIRIADRAAATFIRVRVGLGVSTALIVWARAARGARARPGPVPVRGRRRGPVGPAAGDPRARVLPRLLPHPARARDRRPGARRDGGGRVRGRRARLVRAPGDPPLARRPRRPPGAADPGDRRDEPARA